MEPKRPIVVVGGGLAGIAAAVDLGRAGEKVILLERRRALGGRASSFWDPKEEKLVDSCQHVLLGCCHELRALLKTLGSDTQVAWRDRFVMWAPDGGGTVASLGPVSWLPAPLCFLPSFLVFPCLSWRERWAVLRGLAAAARARGVALDALEEISFEKWLSDQRQPPRAITRFWEPVIVSALNESIGRASARAALFVIQGSFLGTREDARFGVPAAPLLDLYGAVAMERLAALGVETRLGTAAVDVRRGGEAGFHIALETGAIEARGIVIATPFETWPKMLSSLGIGSPELEHSPIVGAHFFFGPEVAAPAGELALVERTAQWIFDRHAATGRPEDRGHLAIVVSAARALVDRPREEIEAALLADIEEAVPEARGKRPRRVVVVKERAATFSAAPGAERRRPAPATAVPGLVLAGDAVATGWPATMESAVRSGRLAARTLLEALATAASGRAAGAATRVDYPSTAHG